MTTDLITEKNNSYYEGLAVGEVTGERRGIALGEEIGEKRGRQEGALSMVIKLVKLGMIPISVACEQLGIKEKEFNKFLSMY